SEEQVNEFAGNILEVKSKDGNPLIVMSSRAYHSFTNEQVNILSKFGKIVHSPLPTIETCGGGSARCMIAEVFQREEYMQEQRVKSDINHFLLCAFFYILFSSFSLLMLPMHPAY